MQNPPPHDASSGGGSTLFPPGVVLRRGGAESLPRFRLHPAESHLLGPNAARKRIEEFTLGRGLAREALGALEPSLAERAIPRTTGRTPRWPEGFVGAITHHRGQAAAVAARAVDYKGLGVDLETRRHPSGALLRRILRPGELEALEGLPERELALRFTLVFSAKESLYKALNPHTGVFLGFQDAEILAPEKLPLPETEMDVSGSGRFQWRLNVSGGTDYPPGYIGEGGYRVEGESLLTGVWVGRG